jgi:hypothetical protein
MRYLPMRGRSCWLCGRNGNGDPLDKHHIFGGANRKLSEEYGLEVPLCHYRCHQFGPEAVHRNTENMQKLHEYGQALAMERNGWSLEEFRAVFGKNYLPEDWQPDSTRNEMFRVEEEEPGESFEHSRLAAILGIRPGDDEEEDEIA